MNEVSAGCGLERVDLAAELQVLGVLFACLKKKSGAGAAKKFAGSPVLIFIKLLIKHHKEYVLF